MTSTHKAIIFDLGNVLIKWDLHPLMRRFFPTPQAVDSFLAEVSFLEWNAHQDQGRPFAEGISIISAQYPQYAHIFQHFHNHWSDTIQEHIPGTVAIAKQVKAAGYPIYLLSNFSAETFPLACQLHPFLNIFDDAIISGEVGMIKPNPAIFHYTLDRIQRKAEECVFIDDHLPNIETARQLGFTAIHFRAPGELKTQLQHLKVL